MKKLFIILTFTVLLTGCGLFRDNTNLCSAGFHLEGNFCVENPNDVSMFENSDDIMNVFNNFKDRQILINSFMRFDTLEDATTDVPSSSEDGGDDYSGTNNQVDGVDEMDNVLTDGKYIYIQNYNKIQIVLGYTEESGVNNMSLVKEISLDELEPNNGYFYFYGMFVDEERLIVLGSKYEYVCSINYDATTEVNEDGTYQDKQCEYIDYLNETVVLEYDKENFDLVNEYTFSGYYVGTRKIDNYLYLVTNQYIPFYRSENEEYNFNLDNYLPYYSINETKITLGYEDIYYVENTNPYNYTNFFGLNLETQEISTEVVLGEGGYNLYVSENNIYLTNTSWIFLDAAMIEFEDAVANDEEYIPEENPFELTTSIIKININNGLVKYQDDTTVPGLALEQFAMDEKDGYLRIVTSGNNWWWWGTNNEINNRLIILDENLNQVSMLENIGKEGEMVQATRFVGNYAYVVTFLRTDPFYVFDLSDPLNPIKLDDLEIPGFSDYLQPINEDYILGIGYGDNDGGTAGLKISLYDVSDKSDAKVASEIIYPYSDNSYMWTSTVYNHKDLLVALNKGIIVLPYTLNDYSSDTWQYHTGALVLNIDIENGLISERARVEHSNTNYYDTYVYKAKYIEEYLFTISSKYVIASTIDEPDIILNQVLIGESKTIEVPGEVDPGEINDPDIVCEDGYVFDETGNCVTESNTGEIDPTLLFEEFIQLYSWDELLIQGEDNYYVYVYNSSDESLSIYEEIYEFGLSVAVLYVVNLDNSDTIGFNEYDILPVLINVQNNDIFKEYLGIEDIIQFIYE